MSEKGIARRVKLPKRRRRPYHEEVRCDLHVHTHCSDGALPPAKVLQLARSGLVELLSITDHDTVAAYDAIAGQLPGGLRLLPGVEISTSMLGEGELHILGYFPRGINSVLREALDEILVERTERMREGVGRLARDAGLPLAFEDVLTRCSGPVISRSHLAQAMVDKGIVGSYADAFRQYIGSQHPFITAPRTTPERAIDLIRRARGISIWAHPRLDRLDRRLAGLVAAGLNGIEVYGRNRNGEALARLEAAADEHRLLKGGGSDWHGHAGSDRLGAFTVAGEQISQLLSLCRPPA